MATIVESGAGYRVQIRRQGQPPISKSGFRTKGDAKVWARAAEGALDRGERVDPGRMLFQAVLDAYAPLAKGSARSKPAALAAIGKMLGTSKLSQLTAQRFIRFAADRRAQGAGPATILQDLSYVGTALRHGCVAAGVSAAQPLLELASARSVLGHSGQIAKPVERDRRPTEAELQALCSHWRRHPCREIPMVDLMLFACATAMRLGEITRLDRPDLDTVGRTVLVRDRKHPTKKLGNHQRVPLLAGPFVLGGQVVDPMAIIARQEKLGTRLFPYKPESVSAAFTRAVKTCGIVDLHFHDLRHEGCSLLFEAGYEIQQVALCSGHQDWNMLRRYTKLNPETLHRTPATTNVVPMVR